MIESISKLDAGEAFAAMDRFTEELVKAGIANFKSEVEEILREQKKD